MAGVKIMRSLRLSGAVLIILLIAAVLWGSIQLTGKSIAAGDESAGIPPSPSPANFLVSSLLISPAEVYPGEAVSIRTVVFNNGGSAGEYELVLKLNEGAEESRTVALEARQTQDVVFEVKKDGAGQYAVELNGKTGRFTVRPASGGTASPDPATSPAISPDPATSPAASPSVVTPSVPDAGTDLPSTENRAFSPVMWWIIAGVIAALAVCALIGISAVKRKGNK